MIMAAKSVPRGPKFLRRSLIKGMEGKQDPRSLEAAKRLRTYHASSRVALGYQ